MGPPLSLGLGSASRCPLWTIDVATGIILDWNSPAARLCGWSKGGQRRPFGELSQLLAPPIAARAKRITIAAIVRLARSRKKEGHGLETRFVRPGRSARYLALDACVTGGQRRNESVLLIATMRRSVDSVSEESGALSAIIAHELRNIAVPLEGFRELAMQSTESEAVREFLNETQIAVGRLTALALGLEGLGESASPPAQVAIGQCIPQETDGSLSGQIDWLCSAKTTVTVDRFLAQGAIRALVQAATRVAASSPRLLTIAENLRGRARCVYCDARVTRWVSARVSGSSPVEKDALKNPFGAGRMGGVRRLMLAALVHCAHGAGGHLILDETSGSLSVAFPAG